MTPQEQAHAFAAMTICGMGMGAAYDLLGPFRRIKRMCALTDLFFGICCASGIVVTALKLRCEPFRFYVFAAAGCGMALYGMTLGNAWRRILRYIRSRIQKKREICKN